MLEKSTGSLEEEKKDEKVHHNTHESSSFNYIHNESLSPFSCFVIT
jgi:hypothetical protein